MRALSLIVVALLPAVAFAADPAEVALKQAEELSVADKPAAAEPLFLQAIRDGDTGTKRKGYGGLMATYIKSGRQDKAIQLAGPYRAWLQSVNDTGTVSELDLRLGICYLHLGHFDRADAILQKALAASPPLSAANRLDALHGRASVADQRRDPAAPQRWQALADVARSGLTVPDNDYRVAAARMLAEALDQLGQPAEAVKVLEPIPEVYDQLRKPIGRRDVQRQRGNLLGATKQYDAAATAFTDALALHRKHKPDRRVAAGDILAEWSVAAKTNDRKADADRLRDEAAAEYKAAITAPPLDDPDGGPLAAFAKLQAITKSARQFKQALAVVTSDGARWSGDDLLASRLAADRGSLELLAADYASARKELSNSLARLEAADPMDLRVTPRVMVELASAELVGPNPENADPLLTRCIKLYADFRLPEDPLRAECDYVLGLAASQRGDYRTAIARFREGLARVARLPPSTAAAAVRFNLSLNSALVFREQGDLPEARAKLDEAAAALATFAEPTDLTYGLVDAVRADLSLTEGNVRATLPLVPRMDAVCAANGLKGGYIWETARFLRGAEQFDVKRDFPAAEAALAELADAQRRVKSLQLPRTLNYLAILAEVQGRTGDAVARFEEAREFQRTRPGGQILTRAVTHWRLAVLKDAAGQKAEARKLLEEMFDAADRKRLETFGEAAQRADFFAQFAPLFELAAAWAARDGDGDALLAVAARSRSRTLLDRVLASGVDPRAGLAGPGRAKLLADEEAARRDASRIRAKLLLIPSEQADKPEAQALVAELDAARKRFADAWKEIVNEDPATRALADPNIAREAVARVRQALPADTAVLTYVFGRAESYAVLLPSRTARAVVVRLTVPQGLRERVGDPPPPPTTGGTVVNALRGIELSAEAPQPDRPAAGFDGPPVPLTEKTAGRLVTPYLDQVRRRGFTPVRGIELAAVTPDQKPIPSFPESVGDAFLPPELRAEIKKVNPAALVVIPDGPLHKLPLECLALRSDTGPPKFALDELPPAVVCPSAAVLAAVSARPKPDNQPATLLTVADPAYGQTAAVQTGTRAGSPIGRLSRLPGTLTESDRVRTTFPATSVTRLVGEDATKKRVSAALAGKRFVHMAAHGFADDRFGNLFAAVALTPAPGADPPPDDDGFLSLPEIYRQKLDGCEMVVLSACVTNVGPQRPLEAGVTLGGAFLSAGARRVAASSWAVSDQATADLMSTFFASVRPADGRPVAAAAALQAARKKLRTDPNTVAPFYWAPFVLLGAPD